MIWLLVEDDANNDEKVDNEPQDLCHNNWLNPVHDPIGKKNETYQQKANPRP
jgi:hypothetical protein